MSCNPTVIASVLASVLIAPKNWKPSLGPRFGFRSSGLRREQSLFDPRHLSAAEKGRFVARRRLAVRRVRAAIAALIEHDNVKQWAVTEGAIDSLGIVGVETNRHVIHERASFHNLTFWAFPVFKLLPGTVERNAVAPDSGHPISRHAHRVLQHKPARDNDSAQPPVVVAERDLM